ncbi:hypothetical protein [Sorangium sp. So ce1024]|uniref:hypothetical protein n=1 Tax=Sorangium sp. So ce1024 TaxID=3133327 RepID=UPI003F029FC0
MTNGNERPVGARLDEIAKDREMTIEALLDEVNQELAARGARQVSRITFWKWRTARAAPDLEQAIVLEDRYRIPMRAWPATQPSQQKEA